MKGKTLPKLIGHLKIDEGRVIECFQETIIIMLLPDCSSQSTCSACMEKCTCAQSGKSETLSITGEHLPECIPGMRTRVSHFVINKTIAALLVFVFPLLSIVAAMLFGQYFTSEATESVWTILSGTGGLLAGFLVIAIVDRVIKTHIPAPEIVAVF